jgi:hypothetical protein
MDYTPIQLQAFWFIAHRRRLREMSEQLHINALAARGDEGSIQKHLRELQK